MRIGCLQFAPKVGDIENNLNRADAVLSKANVEELDLMVLPELAFSGKFDRAHSSTCPSPPSFISTFGLKTEMSRLDGTASVCNSGLGGDFCRRPKLHTQRLTRRCTCRCVPYLSRLIWHQAIFFPTVEL